MSDKLLDSLPGDERRAIAGHLRARVLNDMHGAFDGAKQIAKDNNNSEFSHIDGVGEMTASIDSRSYHYWAHREGPDVWSDKQFMKEYLRDNPEARVKSKSGKIQVGYSGDGFIRHRAGRKIKVYS